MTIEEAIKTIELAIAEVEWVYPIDYAAAFDVAISALRAQQGKPSGGWLDVVDVIEREPAVDAVEVVRCGECKYYIRELMSPGSGWCECLERGEYEKHFCSYGERKMDGGMKNDTD